MFISVYISLHILSSAIQQSDPAWYQALVGNLTEEQRKDIDEIFRLSDQRRAAAGTQTAHFLFICACSYSFVLIVLHRYYNLE